MSVGPMIAFERPAIKLRSRSRLALSRADGQDRDPAMKSPSRLKTPPAHEILVPIDFSSASRATLLRAVGLAKALRGQLTLLHVSEPPTYGGSMSELPGSLPPQIPIAPEKLARRLQVLARRSVPAALAGEILVGEGVAGETIVAVARQRRCRLIISATHGYSGMKRMLLGSTAEYIVRHSPCPVLTIRRPNLGKSGGTGRIHSILSPVDLSAPSKEASGYATDLAVRLKARLTLLNVVPPIDSTGSTERTAASAARQLEKLAAKVRPKVPQVKFRIAIGRNPAAAIVADDTASAADLIVIATHGRGGLGRILIGSTAEGVIREATCPVLIVRRPKPAPLGWYNPLLFFPVAPVMP